MRIVIEIDENQSGRSQSAPSAAQISMESTASSWAFEPANKAAASSFSAENATDAGAGPSAAAAAGGFAQMESNIPFMGMPSAAMATTEASLNDSSAGAAPGESPESYPVAENTGEIKSEE